MSFEARTDEVHVRHDTAVSLGLIANEFVTNSAKHAFPKAPGSIFLELKAQENQQISLTLSDNGIGISPQNRRFSGLQLIAGLAEQLSVVISGHQEITPADGTRGSGGADDIEVNVPAPGDGNGQVLLYAAEDGSLSWHYSVDVPPEEVPTRGGERRTYRVPKAVVPAEEQDGDAHRGIVGAIGKKILKVLVFPLVDPVLGKADAAGRFTPESVWMEWKAQCFGQKKTPSPWLSLVVHRMLTRASAASGRNRKPASRT